MHAPGIPPQHHHRPGNEGVVALRVVFALLPVLSCGFLAWGTMLRLAIVTRATRDWTLLALSCVLSVAWVVLIGMDPTPDTSGWQGNAGAGGTLLTGFATCVYFLVADIRHHENRALAPAAPWYPAPNPAYGYPPVQSPVQTPVRNPVHTPVPSPVPTPPPPQVPPQPTPPPRIGQVRAELDELSELLRKQTPHPPRPGGPYQDPNPTAVQDPEQ